MTRHDEEIYEDAKFYKDKKIAVHIWLKEKLPNGKNKYFRGIILDVDQDFKDRLVLVEESYGELLLRFERIKSNGIEPRKKEKGVGE